MPFVQQGPFPLEYQLSNGRRVAQCVLINGLRRSGTTVLWETLRKDSRNRCFDEPFHRDFWQGIRQNGKGSRDELGKFWNDGRLGDVVGLQPIFPKDELVASSSPKQLQYFQSLMRSARQTVIDDVRIWNRLPELISRDIETVVVHLLREPVSWVSAHMLPGRQRSRRRMVDVYDEWSFFRRRGRYDNWRYQEIIEAALAKNHPVFSDLPLSCQQLARQPAYVKLAAFWWAANLESHRRLAKWSGGKVLTITLGEFSAEPAGVIERIYAAAGWQLPGQADYSHVRPIRRSWCPQSPMWADAFERIGIPLAFAEGDRLDGQAVFDLFAARSVPATDPWWRDGLACAEVDEFA